MASMTRKLIDAGEETITGVHPSLPTDRIPFWETAGNVFYQDMAVGPIPGQVSLCSTVETGAAVGIIEAELTDGSGGRRKTLFWGDQGKLFRWRENESIATDVSRAVGGAYGVGASLDQTEINLAYRWSFAQWGEWIVATNNVDTPQIYRETDAPPQKFSAMTGLTFTKTLLFHRLNPYLLALNTDIGAEIFHWCDADDLTVWTPTQANQAGKLPLRNLNSQIIAAQDLLGGVGIYGRDQLWLAKYVGPPNIIGADKILDGIGAWGSSAVAVVGRDHYGWGPRGIWKSNGYDSQYIDNPSLSAFLKDAVDYTQASKIVAWPWIAYDTIVFFYPVLGGPSKWNLAGVAYNYVQGTWWPQTYGRQCATPGTVFPFPIAGNSIGSVFGLSGDAFPPSGAAGPMKLVGQVERTSGLGDSGLGDSGLGGYILELE